MYYVCSQGHYVTASGAGAPCPATTTGRCQGRLSPAPAESPEDLCRRCRRGRMIPSKEVGPVCSFCGAQRRSEA